MPPAGLEPAIPTSERAQTLAVDGAATGVLTYPQLAMTVVKSCRTKQERAISVSSISLWVMYRLSSG